MKTQKRRNQLKQIETQSQSGRSMVEMLGVLVIIAVLTIGALVGFRYAMNYYQANQIAHEMNMMRTDARIKIAQGTEKLTLGEPYDPINASTLGHIQFSDDYPVIFDCALADDAVINEENISCHVANAYYIEMKNISQEICRPLSKLIQGMSELIGFEITTETIKAENEECQEGANNIHAVFLAEAVSDLISCEENTDCEESENTPYCDKTRHVCVRCYEHNQCAHTEYCEDNTCKSCAEIDERTPVWGGTECVECIENSDCENPTPKCEGKTCKRCAEINERTPAWDGEKCVECTENRHCASGKGCLSDNTCGNCTKNTQCASNNCQSAVCENCDTSADCTESRACENGICYDSCVEHPSGCASDTHCDSTTLKCEPDCPSSEECPDLQVCNSISGVCEDDCTAEGAIECKNGSHCDLEAQKCALNCQSSEECADLQVCNSISGICEDNCTAEGAMKCKEGYHCDSEAQKCVPNCKSSEECPDLQVCNSKSGVCEDDCTADGAMACKNGYHCDSKAQKCVPNCKSTAECNNLQVCNSKSGICEDNCTKSGAMACKNGYRCDTGDTHKCVECVQNSDCKNPKPICSKQHTCVACKTSDECRLKNASEGNCVTGGACCVAEGMTWSNGKCACPADYGVSETTQGKKICLPYCKEDTGLILLIDHSGSIYKMITDSNLDKYKKYDKAVAKIETAINKLNIPNEIRSAVYLSACTQNTDPKATNCKNSCTGYTEHINRRLKWGEHSVSEIKSALKIVKQDMFKICSTVGFGLDEIIPLCKTGKEKFIVIIWWDNDDGTTTNRLKQLKQKCPNTQIYSLAVAGREFSGATKNFNLNNLTTEYTNILSKVIQQEACIKR